METNKKRLQMVCLVLVSVLLLTTLFSFFVRPWIADARTRKRLGLSSDAYVTDTARDPWIYIDSEGYYDLRLAYRTGGKTLVLPDAVNGILVRRPMESAYQSTSRTVEKLVFPSTVSLDEHNFYLHGWEKLETVVFPEGISDLSKLIVSNVPRLKAVYFPSTLRVLNKNAFRHCEAVTVYYAGTESEWRALGDFAVWVADNRNMVFETPVPKN